MEKKSVSHHINKQSWQNSNPIDQEIRENLKF